MKNRAAQFFNYFSLLIPISLVIVYALVSFYGFSSLMEANQWVERTHTIISSTTEIEKLIGDLELGERGFLITGNEAFLEPYTLADKALHKKIEQTKALVNHNPTQIKILESVESLLKRWLNEVANREISERKNIASSTKYLKTLQDHLKKDVKKDILNRIITDTKTLNALFPTANHSPGHTLSLQLSANLLTIQSAHRSFLLTGEDVFLTTFYKGLEDLPAQIEALHQVIDLSFDQSKEAQNGLISENAIPLQFDHHYARRILNQVTLYVNEWVESSATSEINWRRESDKYGIYIEEAILRLERGSGKAIMDELKTQLEAFKVSEQNLMDQRKTEASYDANRSLLIISAGALLIFTLVIITLYASFRLKRNSRSLEIESAKLKESESVSRSIVDTALDCIITINTSGIILSCNTAVERVFGYNTPELLGQNIKQLMPEHYAQAHDGYIASHISSGIKKSIWRGRELVAKRKDGAEFPIYISIGSADTIEGRIFIGYIRDISQQKLAQTELQRVNDDLTAQNWLRTQVAAITELTQGATDMQLMCDKVISKLSELIGAGHGVIYVSEIFDNNRIKNLSLTGSFAFQQRKNLVDKINIGEGLVGQCAKERKPILLTEVPADYIKINSALGEQTPLNIVAVPILFEHLLVGVIELASFQPITEKHLQMLHQVSENIGIVINNIRNMERTNALLEKMQRQSEELQLKQAELKKTNESLEQQASLLRNSQEELKQQSEELIVSNEELEEKQEALQKQNLKIEEAKKQMEVKARELANASKYKSEFLANMSHELRTPLNSLLLLSKSLYDNREGNLTESQVEDARIIYEGGNDLLALINDIMDLSKVEAGKLNIQIEDINIDNLIRNIKNLFGPVAADRGISFIVKVDGEFSENLDGFLQFTSDSQRLEQILKNLLSNAFKFTEQGSVTLNILKPRQGTKFRSSQLTPASTIGFSVTDTGIGIPIEKQQAIFEAFQQQDGSTSRKYGGTGLGLTISRELAKLLGGEIHLYSREGEGSSFTLYLPMQAQENTSDGASTTYPTRPQTANQSEAHKANKGAHTTDRTAQNTSQYSTGPVVPTFITDDRQYITDTEKTILIIEDDAHFATFLRNLVRKSGYKCLVTNEGRNGLYLATEYEPDGILLDMGLPDIHGSQVLEQLKFSLRTRHIPVQIISGYQDMKHEALNQGAIGYLTKPATEEQLNNALHEIGSFAHAEIKKILLVEDDEGNQRAVTKLLDNAALTICCVNNGAEACKEILTLNYDCVILDLQLPDMSGFDVINSIHQQKSNNLPPIIVYTGKELTDAESAELDKYAATIVIKGAGSPERLLDDVSLFLHSIDTRLERDGKQGICFLHDEDAVLNQRKILLVDDDMRNAYALSKKLIEVGLQVDLASNGQEAVDMLKSDSSYELILMDVMMPVMDGYKATKMIRGMPEYKNVPIIALTAKAMMEDRQKCLEAGASEYLMKPIDFDKLHSLLRIWLFKRTCA